MSTQHRAAFIEPLFQSMDALEAALKAIEGKVTPAQFSGVERLSTRIVQALEIVMQRSHQFFERYDELTEGPRPAGGSKISRRPPSLRASARPGGRVLPFKRRS